MEKERKKEIETGCGDRCNEDFNDCLEHSQTTCMDEFDLCVSSCKSER